VNPLHGNPDLLWARLAAFAPPVPERPDRPLAESGQADFALDPQQERAAAHGPGPILVLAPAGSGKTRTLTARIARLIDNGVPARRILALAFNERAAKEMAERLAGRFKGEVQIRTFHALGYEIVREAWDWEYEAWDWEYEAENEEKARRLAEEIVRSHLDIPQHPGEARRLVQRALTVLAESAGRLTPYENMTVSNGGYAQSLAAAFDQWIAAQRARGLLTFTGMIYFALTGLVEDEALRSRWQTRHDFLLVDEFQDLNAAQMLLLRILASPHHNLFAVGDDDQLIYAWRGAEERHILEFETMYPEAEAIVLDTNYRSGRRIVRHARWLI
jgi:superfamily I DNA/RNA helicase